MRIAGIQISAGRDRERNVQRALDMATVAVEKGAGILCYPALFLTPWFPEQADPSLFSLAQGVADGPLEDFRSFSETSQTVLVVPFFESAAGNYYNSAAVFDNGRLLGVYRKVHIPDLPHYREQFYFSPGDGGFPVFATSRGKIGIQICWDNLFPEGARILALRGAEIVLAPTAASQDTHLLWERALAASAFANNLFLFRVNRVGQEGDLAFYGRSFCVDPWGEPASERAGGTEAIVMADIDPAEREAAMRTWGFLTNRRPTAYEELSK